MLEIEQIEKHEWKFVYPPEYNELMNKFYKGIKLWGTGHPQAAKKIYKEVIEEFPGFIEAYHHLGLLYKESGEDKIAFEKWLKAYQIGKKAFPCNFIPGKDFLLWELPENRPFLRCTHALGLCFLGGGNFAKSIELFEFLISINPYDEQGIRELLIEEYLKIGRYKSALDICEKYKDDLMIELTYGKPYALFKLGDKGKATLLLREAVQSNPKIAKELLKKEHTPPKSFHPGSCIIGGDNEAFHYWQRNGILWEEPEVKHWLSQNTSKLNAN